MPIPVGNPVHLNYGGGKGAWGYSGPIGDCSGREVLPELENEEGEDA